MDLSNSCSAKLNSDDFTTFASTLECKMNHPSDISWKFFHYDICPVCILAGGPTVLYSEAGFPVDSPPGHGSKSEYDAGDSSLLGLSCLSLTKLPETSTKANNNSVSVSAELISSRQRKVPRKEKNQSRKCNHCGVRRTELWHQVPGEKNAWHWYFLSRFDADFSNSCSLSLTKHGYYREHRTEKPGPGDLCNCESCRFPLRSDITCANCDTNQTTVWRRGCDEDSHLCEPCGSWYRRHGYHRSPEKKNVIHREVDPMDPRRYSVTTVSAWSSEGEDGGSRQSPRLRPDSPDSWALPSSLTPRISLSKPVGAIRCLACQRRKGKVTCIMIPRLIDYLVRVSNGSP